MGGQVTPGNCLGVADPPLGSFSHPRVFLFISLFSFSFFLKKLYIHFFPNWVEKIFELG
jgi:hypothetical protein